MIIKNVGMNILDLPDEILRVIFNKLKIIDVFYSLVGVNERFDRLALDPLYIYDLNFLIERSDTHIISLDIHIRNKICKKILPRINAKLTKLTAGPFFMHGILQSVHCPQLYSLSLVNYLPDLFFEHLTNPNLCRLLNDQITHLTVTINYVSKKISHEKESNLFKAILFHGQNLTNLSLFQHSPRGDYLTLFDCNFSSRTLATLTISVNTFDDCLLLLNGSLQSLSRLIISVKEIKGSLSNIDNLKQLVKLKSFSLKTRLYTHIYDQEIVPLLRRMINLQELTLQLPVVRHESTYIDGNHFYNEILQYMSKLNKFLFNIHTHIINKQIRINLPSNDQIRNSFIENGFESIDACADQELLNHTGNCHVYSLPYFFNEFFFLSNCFQGGQFNKVKILKMIDQRPFEYKLFQIISEDFPFLQKLIISNSKPQQNKQDHSSTLITFKYLSDLTFTSIHTDYVRQFLSQTNTSLPSLTNLSIDYEILVTVTNNFTNDGKLLNCAQIKCLSTSNLLINRPENLNSYFPSLSQLKLLYK